MPFDVYGLFIALKSHFTTESYDYFKYKGKVRTSVHSFETRNDRFFFQKLSRKYNDTQLQDLIVANLVHGKTWVGDFLDSEAEEIYFEYMKEKEAFTYNFINTTTKLFTEHTPREVFACPPGQYPILLEKVLNGEISMPTFCVLNSYFGFFDKFDKAMGKDDIVWGKIRLRARKLHPFLQYDKVKIREHLASLLLNKA